MSASKVVSSDSTVAINGTPYADVLRGTDANEIINGNLGDDRIVFASTSMDAPSAEGALALSSSETVTIEPVGVMPDPEHAMG